jgi:hypothetical protein
MDKKVDIELVQLILIGAVILIFSVAFILVRNYNLLWGIIPSGLFTMLVILIPYLHQKKGRDIKGIIVFKKRKGDMVKYIQSSIKTSSSISMLGINLQDILGDYTFRQALQENTKKPHKKLRVCVLRPVKSEIFSKRILDEVFGEYFINQKESVKVENRKMEYSTDMADYKHRVQYTIDKIEAASRLLMELERKKQEFKQWDIELRYIDKSYILNSIIIMDNKMLVVDYLHRRGSECPLIVLDRRNETWQAYVNEFEIMWNLAEPVDLSSNDGKLVEITKKTIEKQILNRQTGWIRWRRVRVSLENQNKLICEADVENMTDHYAECIIYIQLQNDYPERIEMRFHLTPQKSETLVLKKDLVSKYSGIYAIEVDEE